MSFNPYKCFTRRCEWPNEFVDARGHLHLWGTQEYCDMLRMLRSVWRSNSTYNVRFYTLVDEETPIHAIESRSIRVARYETPPSTEHVVRRRARAKAAPDPRHAALQHDLDAIGDAPNDDQGEGDDSSDRGAGSGGEGSGGGEESDGGELVVLAPDDRSVHSQHSSSSSSDGSSVKCLTESSHGGAGKEPEHRLNSKLVDPWEVRRYTI